MESSELKAKVDQYAALSQKQTAIKEELDQMKAYFEKQAEADLKNSKEKTVEYWGTEGAKVSVQQADTVKPIAMTVLKDFFGKTATDFIKSELKETLNENCKQFLSAMAKGDYIESSMEDEVRKITADCEEQQLLCKKLKGKYRSDCKAISKITGMSEEDAGEYAYLIQEVFAYHTIKQIMQASGFTGSLQDAVTQVKASLIIDETIKVTLETE